MALPNDNYYQGFNQLVILRLGQYFYLSQDLVKTARLFMMEGGVKGTEKKVGEKMGSGIMWVEAPVWQKEGWG